MGDLSRRIKQAMAPQLADRLGPRLAADDDDETSDPGSPPQSPRSMSMLETKAYFPEMGSTALPAGDIMIVNGALVVTKAYQLLPVDITSAQTTIDFGQAMTPNDFLRLAIAGQEEYMQVGTLVTGTTYNVTRGLAGTASPWANKTPYANIGYNGTGRAELVLKANTTTGVLTPRLDLIKQSTAYNTQTLIGRYGDVAGVFDVPATGEWYGLVVGDYAGGNYLRYDTGQGFKVSAGGGVSRIDSSGFAIEVATAYSNPRSYQFTSGATVVSKISALYDNVVSMLNQTELVVNAVASGIASWAGLYALSTNADATAIMKAQRNGVASYFYVLQDATGSTARFFGVDHIVAALADFALGGNFLMGGATAGSSGARVLAMSAGTAPTTSPADVIQVWEQDQDGVAGRGALHLRAEDGTRMVFGRALWVGLTTGGLTGAGDLEIAGRLKVGNAAIIAGGFTLTVPATGTAALLGTANTFTAAQIITVTDTATAITAAPLTLRHASSNTPAAGFGTDLFMQGEDDGHTIRSMFLIRTDWSTAASATRKARAFFFISDTVAREGMRMEADGSTPMIGFLGANAVARKATYTKAGTVTRTMPADPSAAYTGIATGVGGTPYAALTDLNTLRAVVSSLEGVVRQLIEDLSASTSGFGLFT